MLADSSFFLIVILVDISPNLDMEKSIQWEKKQYLLLRFLNNSFKEHLLSKCWLYQTLWWVQEEHKLGDRPESSCVFVIALGAFCLTMKRVRSTDPLFFCQHFFLERGNFKLSGTEQEKVSAKLIKVLVICCFIPLSLSSNKGFHRKTLLEIGLTYLSPAGSYTKRQTLKLSNNLGLQGRELP